MVELIGVLLSILIGGTLVKMFIVWVSVCVKMDVKGFAFERRANKMIKVVTKSLVGSTRNELWLFSERCWYVLVCVLQSRKDSRVE